MTVYLHIHRDGGVRRSRSRDAKRTRDATLSEVRTRLSQLGVVIDKKDGEFRVAFKTGSPFGKGSKYGSNQEASAYYTDDLNDALQTGLAMAKRAGAQDKRTRDAELRDDEIEVHERGAGKNVFYHAHPRGNPAHQGAVGRTEKEARDKLREMERQRASKRGAGKLFAPGKGRDCACQGLARTKGGIPIKRTRDAGRVVYRAHGFSVEEGENGKYILVLAKAFAQVAGQRQEVDTLQEAKDIIEEMWQQR